MIGVHTMWNEHFGISVVEGMAAGNIMIASDSGGPKMDILHSLDPDRVVGFLADTAEQYAERMVDVIVGMDARSRDRIRLAARDAALRFSEEHFAQHWCDAIAPLVQ
uniref:Glycosyl transferase family 1 domain-containing protein n=1 Tax=Plectus sambesii TaxID=2011161 RepID=A0A914UP43_9BILA